MKFKIKSLDNHEEDWANTKRELKIIEDFYITKYNKNEIEKLSMSDSYTQSNVRIVNWKKNDLILILSIDHEVKTIAKVSKPSKDWEPFEKDELKLFDLLDYNIHFLQQKQTGQEVTDWAWM